MVIGTACSCPAAEPESRSSQLGSPLLALNRQPSCLFQKWRHDLRVATCFSPPASPLADPLLDLLPARCACKIAQKSHPLFIPDSSTSFRSCSVDA